MNGEDNYVIIDLWSRIGELSELNWGWVHAQLTGVFRKRKLSALVHHQVGSSRFSTSSSSGYIQQLFQEVDYSSSRRVSPSYRVTVVRDKAIRFLIYRGQNFRMLLLFISEHLHYPSPGRRVVQLEYQASYQQCPLSGRRCSAWANWFEEYIHVLVYWATISSACCFHHGQRGTITLLHLIRSFNNSLFIILEHL